MENMGIDTEWALRISRATPHFKKSDRIILKYITDFPQDAAFLSLKELSFKTGTSKPTLIEFYRKLGYGSYREFLDGIKSFYEHHIDSYRASTIIFRKIDSIESLIGSAVETEMRSMKRLLELVTSEDLEYIAESIMDSKGIYFFGPGTGYYPAHFLCQRLKRYKLNTHLIENDFQHLAEEIFPAGEGDVLIVFNYFPEPSLIENVMSCAKGAGSRVILVTGNMYLSLAKYSDRVIYINRGDIGFKNSMAVPMSFANMILLALELKGGNRYREHLRELEERREKFKLLL